MNVIKNFSYATIAASTVGALGCHFLNSPKLEKMKTLAIVIGLGAAMVYGYLDTPSKSSPLASRGTASIQNTNSKSFPLPQAYVSIVPIQGTKTQFRVPNGKAACTVMAAEALISMIKGTKQTGSDID